MNQEFIHLRTHTEYSLVDSIIDIDYLLDAVKHNNMSAVAVTDLCNLFAVIKFYQASLKKGIKPIIGADILVDNIPQLQESAVMTLLCQDAHGYKNLTQLISKAYLEGKRKDSIPMVNWDWLKNYSLGLILLSGGVQGPLGLAFKNKKLELAESLTKDLAFWFKDRFYIEIQRVLKPLEDVINPLFCEYSQKFQIPLVATNDLRFLHIDDFEAHEARVCIHNGYLLTDPKRPKIYSKEQYFKSVEEMKNLFHDLPQALANTVNIAKRCSLHISLGKNCLPDFETPDNSSEDLYLTGLAKARLKDFLEKSQFLEEEKRIYIDRLQEELNIIINMGFPGYFLVVADFIKWAKDADIPVGPGRGSGVGSLVAYMLKITDLDPLKYDLLFERFLNPERVSLPDFDIDFCMEGRDKVIEYVNQKYGHDKVSQIITFGTMAAKAVVRDVGRVLGYPYGFVDKIAKLIPFELGITLEKALAQEELQARYNNEEEVKELFTLALKLEGLARNAGKHAGGVVIAPTPLTDYTAIYCEEGSTQIVSQFDKDDVEAAGLVKFDFLGLRTLTIIKNAVINIEKQTGKIIDWDNIGFNDKDLYTWFETGKTTAVFQLESRGIQEFIRKLKVDNFEDIIALVALYRPGPLQSGMVEDYINRKHKITEVEYLHPDLEKVLKPTYGVILYQEQVMQIAQILANYSLGEADLLRRAMGKKKPEEMAKQRKIFTNGALKRGIDKAISTSIFDLMEKFAGYGFNKSHSAAYAVLTYKTAWLKCHFPQAFMAAVLSSEIEHPEKIVHFMQETRSMGIIVRPPNIQDSMYEFTLNADNNILYGLGAIKGIGFAAIESILAERVLNGSYSSLFDFCKRLESKKINKKALEVLIKAGAFDCWGINRAVLLNSIESALKFGIKSGMDKKNGQLDLFAVDNIEPQYISATAWDLHTKLKFEKEVLGIYMSAHPTDLYKQELCAFAKNIKDLSINSNNKNIILGSVIAVKQILTKRGKKMAVIKVEDANSTIEVVVFPEVYKLYEQLLMVDNILLIEGDVSEDEYSKTLRFAAINFYTINGFRNKFLQKLIIILEKDHDLVRISNLLQENIGSSPVQLRYRNDTVTTDMNLNSKWRVRVCDELLQELKICIGAKNIKLCYAGVKEIELTEPI